MPKVIVSDSSPIIHLSKIGELNLLKELFGQIIIPDAVYKESVIEENDEEDAAEIGDQEWIKVQEIDNMHLKKALDAILDKGEAEAIVLSVEKSADLLLLDDYEAREMAKKLELQVTGTIGVLLLAKKMGVLSKKFKELLDELRNTGFWLSEELYNTALKEAEKF